MTKQISWTVWSQTGGPGGPSQVAERQTGELISSCCARLERSEKGNCGHKGGGDLLEMQHV